MKRAWIWTLASLVAVLSVSSLNAAIVYKDATNPNGVPDFSQQRKPAPRNGGGCWEVAIANCLWYFDHHGFSGLFPHSTGDPGAWQTDGQTVIDELIDRARGLNGRKRRGTCAAEDFIRNKGKHWIKGTQSGLKVKEYWGTFAVYTSFVGELSRSQDVIPYWKAHLSGAAPGVWVTYLEGTVEEQWYHAQTAAGYDNASPPTKTVLTNGWRNSAGQTYDNPTLVATVNYEIFPMRTAAGDKFQLLPGGPVMGKPPGNADYLEMVAMMTICPVDQNGNARNTVGSAAPVPGSNPPTERYSYVVSNLTDASGANEPIYVVAIAIEPSFSFGLLNVQSPAGWTAQEWNSANTPGICRNAPYLDPDDPNDAAIYGTTPARGVLWTTASNPIAVGQTMSGFSFDFTAGYTKAVDASATALGKSTLEVDQLVDYGSTLGPVTLQIAGIPTVGEWGLIIMAALILGAGTIVLSKRRLQIST